MNSAPSLAPRRHRRRSAVVTAALTLPLLAVTACGTTTGTETPGGTNPSTPPAAGTGTSGGTSGARDPSGTTAPEATAAPTTSTAGGTTTHVRAGVYFLHSEKVSPAPRTVTAPATATAAVRALLAGPDRYERAHGRATAIPSGTRLRSLVVRNHVATVDLSGRYDDGGGSSSMRERLAQVVFTVTRFPTVHKVAFEVDGKPVTSFGGEGIVLNGPVGRSDFEDRAPAVLVESPLIGDTARTPLRVRGSADTFEAQFRLRVTDTTGRTAADVVVRATSGTGTRGTFDVTFPCKAARTGPGLLTAYVLSPKDGQLVTVDTVPLTVNR
ncbi:GerMN domain-containing protein [Streptomyces mirabilis]|uniref:Spore germination protein GerM n=1 Tax=Streptomyces mirabilis TaxID=68239 RepID=A0A1I1Z7R7_9ACTN|nr:GerMN domain-containing protein [Streptomyces mirabilis]SFE27592.1 Spore germination protein GerM [Streptomyces mirabilis]